MYLKWQESKTGACHCQNVSVLTHGIDHILCTVTVEMENLYSWSAASSSSDVPLWLTFLPHISSWPAAVLSSTADPKKTPTTKRPSNLVFILPWWVQPAQSDLHWLALNWNCIHLNHPSHPKQPVETKAALIASTSSASAPSPMHLAFLIGEELLCLHWRLLIELDP